MRYLLSNKRGSTLLLALIAGLSLFLVGLATSNLLNQTSKQTGKRNSSVRLLNIAESGKEHGLAMLRNKKVTPVKGSTVKVLDSVDYRGGKYYVSCKANASLDTFTVVSSARYKTQKKAVEVSCVNNIVNPYDTCKVFDYMLFSGSTFSWIGSGGMSNGLIHSNSDFNKTGSGDLAGSVTSSTRIECIGSGQLIGNATAPIVLGSSKITGTTLLASVITINIPDINLQPFYDYANSKGMVSSTSQTITGTSPYLVTDSIMWVNGNFKKAGSGSFTGCVIATGNIDIDGAGACANLGNLPFLISINGDITWTGTSDGQVEGLILAKNGKFRKVGAGKLTLKGQIIAKNGIEKTGSGDFNLQYNKVVPVPPSGGYKSSSFSVIAWKEI